MTKRGRSPLRSVTMVLAGLLFPGCATTTQQASLDSTSTTYSYYVDSETRKPYSSLYEVGPVRYVIQFPGHDPFDEFLYGDDFVAYLYIASEATYSVRDLRLNLERNGKELFPPRNSFLSDMEVWKAYTKVVKRPNPAGRLELDPPKRALVGFIFRPDQLDGLSTTALVIRFDVMVGGRSTKIKRRFLLQRTEQTEVSRKDPRVREREPGDVVLVGPWWLEKQDMAREHDSCVARAATNEQCAIRIGGRGFLPRVRYDPIHFEGFFLHVDR